MISFEERDEGEKVDSVNMGVSMWIVVGRGEGDFGYLGFVEFVGF